MYKQQIGKLNWQFPDTGKCMLEEKLLKNDLRPTGNRLVSVTITM